MATQMTAYQILFNTCPDNDTAQRLATSLVTQRLAACVNIIPGIHSVYHWQGQCHQDTEWLLIIKASAAAYTAIAEHIQSNHPYDCPELIALPVSAGLPDYLTWISQQSQAPVSLD